MTLLIYTNILTPYRKYFYDLLYDECKNAGDEFYVLVMAETEPNRTWTYQELRAKYTILLNGRTFSMGEAYFHTNYGLKKTLKKLAPDIVVCAGGYNCPGVWKIARLSKVLGYKCFFWSESHLNEIKKSKGYRIYVRECLRKYVYNKFNGFWYAGKLSREFCEKYARPNAKYFFLPNLIEECKFTDNAIHNKRNVIRATLDIEQNTTVFICPARLSPTKGILEFLELIQYSKEKEKAVILIAGYGRLKEIIEKKANEYMIDVRLIGQKKQSEMLELYAAADIFLMPSLSDPNPLTCIEALWEGLPLFISEHCGNYPEVIKFGENGYVFSYDDREKAIEYFDYLINSSREWRKHASQVSYVIAQELYESQGTVKRILTEMRLEC